MKNIPKYSGINRALPVSVVYLIALILTIVGIGAIWYGFNDGILHQDISARAKSGRIAYFTGTPAVVAGAAITCIGAVFTYLAIFIVRNEREQRIIKGAGR